MGHRKTDDSRIICRRISPFSAKLFLRKHAKTCSLTAEFQCLFYRFIGLRLPRHDPLQKQPAGSGTERVVVAILWFCEFCETWYLQCFVSLGYSKMHAITVLLNFVCVFSGKIASFSFFWGSQKRYLFLNNVILPYFTLVLAQCNSRVKT